MAFAYSDMDKLIIERWPDVVGLIDAHRVAQDRIEEMINVVGERVARWARPMGYETDVTAKDAEFRLWRTGWAEKRRGPKAQLAIGGFCPAGFRKVDTAYPYLWVYIDGLAEYKMKDPDRVAFTHALRSALGEQARSWDADGVDDADQPLGRYLTSISDEARAQLIGSPDLLLQFVTENFAPLREIADVIDVELSKLGK